MSHFRQCGSDILISLDIGHVWRNHRNFVPDSTKMARLGYELVGLNSAVLFVLHVQRMY